jgi:putative methyltransferase (TIGR04325 family)
MLVPPLALLAAREMRRVVFASAAARFPTFEHWIPRPRAQHWHAEYTCVAGWPAAEMSFVSPAATLRYKSELETFDLSTAMKSLIVRDNLTLLRRIGLPHARILDFGCGTGTYSQLLAAWPATAQWKYVGVDINSELIELCATTFQNARFLPISYSGALPFEESVFDVVMASGSLQYVKDPVAALVELRHVAKDYLLLSRMPVWKYVPSRIVVQHVAHLEGEERHPEHVFNRDELERLFTRVGFAILLREYGSELTPVAGIAEPAMSVSYLLKKTSRSCAA